MSKWKANYNTAGWVWVTGEIHTKKNKLELDTKTCIICESQGCDIATVKKIYGIFVSNLDI